MKKQTKGIIFVIIFGGGLLFWATAASMPNVMPPDPEAELTMTGTPADNFPDVQRAQFCGSGEAKSNAYIKEFKIPTECTQPLAIASDPQGNIWFAQTNTGKVAKFNPQTESFTEFENQFWPKGSRSMMWGMDYSPDGSIWYTDEFFDSIWKFSIQDETYQRLDFPGEADSLPQRLKVMGSQIIVNDFTGNNLAFLDPAKTETDIGYFTLPSPVENSVTGDFAVDQQGNIWYTNWVFQQGGVLVKFDQEAYEKAALNVGEQAMPLFEHLEVFPLPAGLTTPNGAEVDSEGKIWLADTSSSFFFSFDPSTETFTKYITSDPPAISYGNASGLIKTPVTRPYWIELDQNQNMVINEQTGNRIAIFDPIEEKLVEYTIPSMNPNWADCEGLDNCGLAQVFGITIIQDKIWFTEWAENNIGVLDRSIPLPVDAQVDKAEITLKKGETENLILTLSAFQSDEFKIISTDTSDFNDLVVTLQSSSTTINGGQSTTIPITISAGDNALTTTHKLLLGAQTNEVTISKYVTVKVEP